MNSRLIPLVATLLLALVSVFAAHTTAPRPPPARNAVPSETYREGVLVVRFSEDWIPDRNSVSLSDATFGVTDLDTLLSSYGAFKLEKLLPGYGVAKTSAGRRLNRVYIIHYSGSMAAGELASALSSLPYFDTVSVDHIIPSCYFGTVTEIPDDEKFSDQWSLDYSRDSVDIDMPEAWAIEKGHPSMVIGILDTGTMLDTSGTTWELHPEFTFLFTEEDNTPLEQLSWTDYDTEDAADEDSLFHSLIGKDNVIGTNHRSPYRSETDSTILSFWFNTPVDWLIAAQTGWGVSASVPHGTNVGGIAAAKAQFTSGGAGMAGIANGCAVYYVSRGNDLSEIQQAQALIAISDFADVINMSWGFCSEPQLGFFKDTIEYVAEERDVVLVAAVGNKSKLMSDCPGTPLQSVYPARYAWVMGVSNMDSTLTLYDDSVFGPNIGDVSVTGAYG